MPDWILLLPMLFPVVGALVLHFAVPGVSARTRPWLPIVFLTIEIIAILVNIAPGSHAFTLSVWTLASFAIAFQIDGVTLLFLLAMFVPLIAIWLIAPPLPGFKRVPYGLLPTLVLTGALLVAAAGNALTVYLAWALLDVALFAWRLAYDIEKENALRTFAVSQSAGLVLFAGALLLGGDRAAEGAALVALAFWARLALFPFHWTLPTHGTDTRDLWFARGVPLIAAANLWLRWSTLKVDAPMSLIGTLAAATLLAAAIWIWRAEQPNRAIVVSASHALALLPLAIAFGGDAAPAFALWLALSAVIALALFEMAQRWRAENRNRYPRLIWFAGIISLAGLPLTPAFLGRVGLYVSLWETGQWLLVLLCGLTTMLILAPLWNLGFDLKGAENRQPTRAEYAGLIVITLAFAALALAPTLIAHALAPGMGDAAERALDRVIRTSDTLGVTVGFAMLVLPVIGSYWLRVPARHFHPRPDALLMRAARVIDLDWLERAVTGIGLRMGALARSTSTIAEENPTVWILLAGLWIAIFISIFHS
jgi:NADH:ubiquinone oxidoreductase subunit 2 (subunit N)